MQTSRITLAVVLLIAAMALAGCRSETAAPGGGQPIFGNGALDNSRILARVNDYAITENMLDLRLEELGKDGQLRYPGPDGRRVFLRHMIDEVLMVREAEARKLHLDPVVARVLIAERRDALIDAQRTDLVKGKEPSIDEVRAFYTKNRDRYMRIGTMHASHIECLTRETADDVYRKVKEKTAPLHTLAVTHSQNNHTKVNGGDLGWFNRNGYIPGIVDSGAFSEAIWHFDIGVNPPLAFGGRWHVVVVHDRQADRPQTLEEAYLRVVNDMQDEFREGLVDGWLRDARAAAAVELYGEYRPGKGRTARELMERAYYVADPHAKLDLLALLVDDYPDDELAPAALFMAANLALDSWGEVRQAHHFLTELITRYPNSELVGDATYILQNMHRPDFIQPRSIEDLRPKS